MNAPEKLSSVIPGMSSEAANFFKGMPQPPQHSNMADERRYRKQELAAAFRIFSRFGLDEGAAGHITVRDPEYPDTFWLNPFGVHFSQICVSNLIRVDHTGQVIEGNYPVNRAAFAIHYKIHEARPDCLAAAHTHGIYGRAFSTLGKLLTMLSQDACAFYNDHSVYNDYGGVVVELDEGERIGTALGKNKAVILRNHGLLTVGDSVGAAAWWYITMERCCQVQLMAEAAAAHGQQTLYTVPEVACKQAYSIVGTPYAGWFQFQMIYERLVREQPGFLN